LSPHPGATDLWDRIDEAAFAIIYGAVMVLSILMAIGAHPDAPLKTAVVLFGSVLAIVMAKAFAEFLAHALKTRERLTGAAYRRAWAHSRASLVAANLPALGFAAAHFGWMTGDFASIFAQVYCIGLLLFLGARVGWVIDRTPLAALLGAGFAGGVGLLLALVKYLIH